MCIRTTPENRIEYFLCLLHKFVSSLCYRSFSDMFRTHTHTHHTKQLYMYIYTNISLLILFTVSLLGTINTHNFRFDFFFSFLTLKPIFFLLLLLSLCVIIIFFFFFSRFFDWTFTVPLHVPFFYLFYACIQSFFYLRRMIRDYLYLVGHLKSSFSFHFICFILWPFLSLFLVWFEIWFFYWPGWFMLSLLVCISLALIFTEQKSQL